MTQETISCCGLTSPALGGHLREVQMCLPVVAVSKSQLPWRVPYRSSMLRCPVDS